MVHFPKLKKDQIVEIIWDDITSDSSWIKDSKAEEYQPVRCMSIGYYCNETKKFIRISDTVNSMLERSVLVIPKGCIFSMKRIKEK